MTLKQEQHLQDLLKDWRDERHLSIESQRDGLLGNLCEEFSEYYRASNRNEKIDALCDIYVFCMNSLNTNMKNISKFPKIYLEKRYRINLLEKINFSLEDNLDSDYLNTILYSLMLSVENEAKLMGYNFYKCMLETIEEISSRTGHYDENIHKFVKDMTPEAVTKWYKADYSKCRITER